MAKKSFKVDNPALAFISAPDTHDAQDALDAQEVQQVHNAPEVQDAPIVHGTQGKRGKKHPRINMAFPADNLEYLQLISRIEGVSITEYVNRLVATDRAARATEIEQAKAILKEAKR